MVRRVTASGGTTVIPASTRRPVSTAVVLAGLFTVSWDRFANVEVGGFNVKISTAAFALALVLTAVDAFRFPHEQGKPQRVLPVALIVLAVFCVMSFFAEDREAAYKQAATVLLGAIVPFAAVFWNTRIFGQLDRVLTWFIRGGWVASVFGLYQLGAFYTGLPQIVPYGAVSGGLGRISSFSYEAAYFGYFLVLVIGALYARAVLRGQAVSRVAVFFFLVVIVLANSRATFFTVPLVFVLIYFAWPAATVRAKLWPAAIVAAFATLILLLIRPTLVSSLVTRATSILDTREATSNVPRLEMYDTASAIIRDYPLTGIGGGNLIRYAPLYGHANPPGATSNSIITNNAWLQALIDGGFFLLLVQVMLVVVAIATLYRRRQPVARMLMAGWISSFAVSSMLTSYYFNSSLWVVLACAAAAAAVQSDVLPTTPNSRTQKRPPAPTRVGQGGSLRPQHFSD